VAWLKPHVSNPRKRYQLCSRCCVWQLPRWQFSSPRRSARKQLAIPNSQVLLESVASMRATTTLCSGRHARSTSSQVSHPRGLCSVTVGSCERTLLCSSCCPSRATYRQLQSRKRSGIVIFLKQQSKGENNDFRVIYDPGICPLVS
jgi:hypothetical protein